MQSIPFWRPWFRLSYKATVSRFNFKSLFGKIIKYVCIWSNVSVRYIACTRVLKENFFLIPKANNGHFYEILAIIIYFNCVFSNYCGIRCRYKVPSIDKRILNKSFSGLADFWIEKREITANLPFIYLLLLLNYIVFKLSLKYILLLLFQVNLFQYLLILKLFLEIYNFLYFSFLLFGIC